MDIRPGRTLGIVMSAAEASALARQHLDPALPGRWRHVQGVGARGAEIAVRLGLADDMLACAAWLHDIGYGPDLAETGFHPLDGARFLRKIGAGDRLARLVAHHSCAVYEARVRGLDRELLGEFEPEESVTADATGASLRELMERMGHSSTRAALMYQHATRERDDVIAAAMGEAFVSGGGRALARGNRARSGHARGGPGGDG
jgi:HD superfamily phosphodiesterase